jgi:hypothetical protein
MVYYRFAVGQLHTPGYSFTSNGLLQFFWGFNEEKWVEVAFF